MAKEFIISTSSINSYGARVLTSGINIEQYKRNPVLLYMHKRGFFDDHTPIGRVENIHIEGDELRGTPVFDAKDSFAAEIGRKWEENFLRMCSAGLEPVELSSATEHLLPGQTRATITASKLVEVSIVDIGSNDDALQLYQPDGKLLKLASGVESVIIPLLKIEKSTQEKISPEITDNTKTNFNMNKILLTLGLAATATEDDAAAAIAKLQANADKVEKIELARIEAAVDTAISKDKKATADKRDHLVALGKTAGFEVLQSTLDMLTPSRKPSDIITTPAGGATVALSYSQMSEEQLLDLRANNQPEYIRLYKVEFGFAPKLN